MLRSIMVVAAVVLSWMAVGSVFAADANSRVSAGVDIWISTLAAEATVSSDSVTGTNVDLIDDLGLDDSVSPSALGLSVNLPFLPELNLSYLALDGQATKTITKPFVVNGATYGAGDNVTSSYDFTEYEANFGFGIIKRETLSLSFLLGAKYFEIQTAIKDNTTGVSFDQTVNFGIPVVGMKAEVGLPAKFKIGAGARGMTLDTGDVNATVLNLDGAVHFDMNKFVRLSIGYRYELIDCEMAKEKDSVDINFAGPFAGITASF